MFSAAEHVLAVASYHSPLNIQSTDFRKRSRNRRSTSRLGASTPLSILESWPWVIPSSGAKSSCSTAARSSRIRRPMATRSAFGFAFDFLGTKFFA
jgi:hypothetical protein